MSFERVWAKPPVAYAGLDSDGGQLATSGDIMGHRTFDADGNVLPAPTALNLGIGLDTNPNPGVDFTYVQPLPEDRVPFDPPLTSTPTDYDIFVPRGVGSPRYFASAEESDGKSLVAQPMNATQDGVPFQLNNVLVTLENHPSGTAVVFNGATGIHSLPADPGNVLLLRFAASGPDSTKGATVTFRLSLA